MRSGQVDVWTITTQRCCDRWSVRIEGAEQMSEEELGEAAREAIRSGEADYVRSTWVEDVDGPKVVDIERSTDRSES